MFKKILICLLWSNLASAGGISTYTPTITPAISSIFFGDGSDGDVTCSGSSTLTRDMYYNNLTLATGCAITLYATTTAVYRIFVAGTLDLTACPAGAVIGSGYTGGNSTANAAGAVSLSVASTNGQGGMLVGTAGAAGGVAGGAQATAATSLGKSIGGYSGASGAGGAGSGGSGGALRALTAPTLFFTFGHSALDITKGTGSIGGGGSGSGGSSGGGDGTAGGGGGGGGSGGPVTVISARIITRGASTAVGCIKGVGGTGGNGGTPSAAAVLVGRGGGGGGAGGGGGGVFVIHGGLVGVAATNAIDVSGGPGGNGGNGQGTGIGGNGGQGGSCGTVRIFALDTGGITAQAAGTSGGTTPTAASDINGVTGGAGQSCKVTL